MVSSGPAAAWETEYPEHNLWAAPTMSRIVEYVCPWSSLISYDVGTQGHGRLLNDSCTIVYTYFAFNLSYSPTAYVDSINVTVPFANNPQNDSSLITWAVRWLAGPVGFSNVSWMEWLDTLNETPNWDTFANRQGETRRFQASAPFVAAFQRAVANGNSTFFFAMVALTQTTLAVLMPSAQASLEVLMDASPPQIPDPPPVPAYLNQSSVDVTWNSTVDDGVGVAGYEVIWSMSPGLTPVAQSSGWLPADSSTWRATALPANGVAYFAVRAVDGIGFISNWSSPAAVVIDTVSPPAVSVVEPQRYWPNASVVIEWATVTDDRAGIDGYEILLFDGAGGPVASFWSSNASMSSASIEVPGPAWNANLSVVVLAVDRAGNRSPPGPAKTIHIDTQPPEDVRVVAEPAFSPGLSNELGWELATDHGSGVGAYEAQVALDSMFSVVLGSVSTPNASAVFSGLEDGVEYFFRVRALDRMGNPSNWTSTSTTQDATPPTSPSMGAVPEWTNSTGLRLTWNASTDSLSGVSGYEAFVKDSTGQILADVSLAAAVLETTFLVLPEALSHEVCVRANDGAGLSSTDACLPFGVDLSPPQGTPTAPSGVVLGDLPGQLEVQGSAFDGLSGVTFVEVRADDGHWVSAAGTTLWSANITLELPDDCSGLRELNGTVWVRAVDRAGNVQVDLGSIAFRAILCPVPLEIRFPVEGEPQREEVLVEVSAPSGGGEVTVLALLDGAWEEVAWASEPTRPGSGSLSMLWDIRQLPDGNYSLKVRLASGQESAPVTVYIRQVQLVATIGTVFPQGGQFHPGLPASASVQVRNAGVGTAGNLTVSVYLKSAAAEILLEEEVFEPLGPGASKALDLSFDLPEDGEYRIVVRVQTDGDEEPPAPVESQAFAVEAAQGPQGGGSFDVLFVGLLLVAIGAAAAIVWVWFRRRKAGT